MTRALQFLMLWSFVLSIVGCCHTDPEAEKAAQLGISPEQNRKMLHDNPFYRYLMEDAHDYKTDTRLFLQRVQAKTNPQQLQDWARTVLEAHKSDGDFFLLPTNSIPSFILKLDPPIEPSVYVFPHSSYVTIFWGGGFGHWGLFVGGNNVPDNPVIYTIEWVPGVYAFHDLQ
ncbi:MAG TPA: hypothetical protein VGM58_07245 [Verrucomicrobiae bacterium]|jgi:hypothetical protein